MIGTKRYGYSADDVESGTCFWNSLSGYNKTTFDGTSNPSSNAAASGSLQQNITSHLGVRNVSTASAAGSPAISDLLVNNWFGHISANTTWGPGAYAITGDITVDSGYTLTIDSGTTVYAQYNEDNQHSVPDTARCAIIVKPGGRLVIGGPGSPVKFISSRPESQAGTEDWWGIVIKPGGYISISNAIIRHAYAGIEDSSIYNHTIQNVRIGRCKMYGILAADTDSLTIRGCRIDSVNNSPGGTGIQVASGSSTRGAKVIADTVRYCYYGIMVSGSTSPVDSCRVVGDSTAALVSNTGIYVWQQGFLGSSNLSVSNTTVEGYFSGCHIYNYIRGRASVSACLVVTNETSPRSPVGVQNTTGDYLKVRGSSIWHWGAYGVKTGHISGGVPDLGVNPSDNGNNDLYTAVGGSGWKYVYDSDCSFCGTPLIKAEYNQWYTTPTSSRFSTNVDFTPYMPVVPFGKIASGEGQQKENLPWHTELFQNSPNPFNPTTLIQFNLVKVEKVYLEIFNILGQKVRTLVSGEEFAAGPYSFLWDGKDGRGRALSSGIYFYRLQTPSFSKTKKMALMK